jgi:plastocyanin
MARKQQQDNQRGRRVGRIKGAVFACFALAVRVAAASGASTREIHIQNFRFDPPAIEVPVGAIVTWVNQDEEIHTVTATQGLFTSPALDGEKQFSYRFEKPGTYEYRCALHPQMQGTIVVR